MSVILIALLLLQIVMHNIGLDLFESQLVLTNDLGITILYAIHAVMLLYGQKNIQLQYVVLANVLAASE